MNMHPLECFHYLEAVDTPVCSVDMRVWVHTHILYNSYERNENNALYTNKYFFFGQWDVRISWPLQLDRIDTSF